MSQPRWLAKPDGLSSAALKLWKTHAKRLCREGTLSVENAESFAALCRLLATARAAEAEINQSGVVFRTKAGVVKQNPACGILFQAQKQAAELLKDFNLD